MLHAYPLSLLFGSDCFIYSLKGKVKLCLFSDLYFPFEPAIRSHVDFNVFDRVFLSFVEGIHKSEVSAFEYVEKDFGTGAVKITPAHDPNDYQVGKRHNLEIIEVISKSGIMTDVTGEKFSGLSILDARAKLVEAMKTHDFSEDFDFLKSMADTESRYMLLEGYLYPDTYEFYEKSDANSVIRKLLQGSETKWTDEYEQRRIARGNTVFIRTLV